MPFGIKVKSGPDGCNAWHDFDDLSTREWQALDSAHHMAPFAIS